MNVLTCQSEYFFHWMQLESFWMLKLQEVADTEVI